MRKNKANCAMCSKLQHEIETFRVAEVLHNEEYRQNKARIRELEGRVLRLVESSDALLDAMAVIQHQALLATKNAEIVKNKSEPMPF